MAQAADLLIDELARPVRQGLRVADVVDELRRVVPPDSPISTVVAAMDEQDVPLIAVGGGRIVHGVITDREITAAFARHGSDLASLKAVDVMAPLGAGIESEMPVSEAAGIMRAGGRKWLPVTDGHDVVSIVSQENVTKGATLSWELGCVGDIMTAEVVTLEATAPLLDAAEVMDCRRISCIVAMHGNEPVGVLTAKDLRRRLAFDSEDLETTIIADVMGFPIISIRPDGSVAEACVLMSRANIHRLVVMEDGRLAGIVTQTDVTAAVDARRAAEEQRRRKRLADCPAPVFATDPDSITTYVNPAFVTFFDGSRRGDFVRQPFLPCRFWTDPTARARVVSAMRSLDLSVQEADLKIGSNVSLRTAIFSAAVRNPGGDMVGRHGVLWPKSRQNHAVRLQRDG